MNLWKFLLALVIIGLIIELVKLLLAVAIIGALGYGVCRAVGYIATTRQRNRLARAQRHQACLTSIVRLERELGMVP